MEATSPRFLVDVPLTTVAVSEPFAEHGLRWKLTVHPGEHVAFYLHCLGADDDNRGESWGCQAKAELRIINHRSDQLNITASFTHFFHSEGASCGFSQFVSWARVTDPLDVKDGKVTFEARIVAEEVSLGKADVVALILSKNELQEKLSKSDEVERSIEEGEKKLKELDKQLEELQAKKEEVAKSVEERRKDPKYLPEKAAKRIRLELKGIRDVAKAVGKVAAKDDSVAEALGERRVDMSCPICFRVSREMQVFACPDCHKWFCGECKARPALRKCCPHCRADFNRCSRPKRNMAMERLLN